MRRPTVFALALALVLGPTIVAPALGQDREPEVRRYRFVSQVGHATALWVNPGWLGFNRRSSLVGHATWDRPQSESWSTSQYMIGLQSGALGFGYVHDEFSDPAGFGNGDAYTVAASLASQGTGVGASRTWYTVGDNEGSWEIGAAFVPAFFLAVGAVWRDIGSPIVRDVVRDERLVGAVTLQPPSGHASFSVEADFRTDQKDFRRFRIGANFTVLIAEALARAEWDGDGDFIGFQIGVQLQLRSTTAFGLAALDSGGDARVASAGLATSFEKRR